MHAPLLSVILLGIVEGLTEFLPVSSTGHLILAGALLGYDEEQWRVFNIVIQLGAILAVVVLYWRTFADVLSGLLRRDPRSIHFVRNLLIAFIPAVIIGLMFHKRIEALLGNAEVVAWALLIGGIAMIVIEKLVRRHDVSSISGMPVTRAIGIGIVQCLAMIPGVSRSGATILGAVSLGVERKTAAEFSFFLAIPTMLGATTLELAKNHNDLGIVGPGDIAVGFVVAFIVALLVIKAFVAVVSKRGFYPFAWYRIIAGIAALVWLASK